MAKAKIEQVFEQDPGTMFWLWIFNKKLDQLRLRDRFRVPCRFAAWCQAQKSNCPKSTTGLIWISFTQHPSFRKPIVHKLQLKKEPQSLRSSAVLKYGRLPLAYLKLPTQRSVCRN